MLDRLAEAGYLVKLSTYVVPQEEKLAEYSDGFARLIKRKSKIGWRMITGKAVVH